MSIWTQRYTVTNRCFYFVAPQGVDATRALVLKVEVGRAPDSASQAPQRPYPRYQSHAMGVSEDLNSVSTTYHRCSSVCLLCAFHILHSTSTSTPSHTFCTLPERASRTSFRRCCDPQSGLRYFHKIQEVRATYINAGFEKSPPQSILTFVICSHRTCMLRN